MPSTPQIFVRTRNATVIFVVCLACIVQIPWAHCEDIVKKIDRTIDSLANKNAPPTVVKLRVDSSDIVPLFLESYDWAEVDRIDEVLFGFREMNVAELWPRLIHHFDDRGYSLTICYDIEDGGDAQNKTVGDFCFDYARQCLESPYRYSLPTGVFLWRFRNPEELREWYKAQKGKPLDELQIEMTEWAIGQLKKLDHIDVTEKATSNAKLQNQISELRKTRIPVVRGPFFKRGWANLYGPELAAVIRKRFNESRTQFLPDSLKRHPR